MPPEVAVHLTLLLLFGTCRAQTVVDCTLAESVCTEQCWYGHAPTQGKKQLRIGLVLPADADTFVPALSSVRPLVALALETAHEQGLIPRETWDVCVIEGDTRCSLEHGLITAVDVNDRCCPHAFIGPTCELSLSSVARLVKLWQTPLITGGAFASDYTVNRTNPTDEYFLLVRSGWSFRDVSLTILAVMNEYNWRRMMLIYDIDGYSDVSGLQTCYLMMTSLVSKLKEMNLDYAAYDTMKNNHQSIKDNLEQEVGNKFASK